MVKKTTYPLIIEKNYVSLQHQTKNDEIMLIGRNEEKETLLSLLEKDESQFCAVYGRQRVGKTFLIKETFDYHFAFYHTGVANASKKEQLTEFRESLRKAGLKRCKMPRTWFEAFHLLEDLLEQSQDEKKIVFIDELPWMDTAKSNFISALEHFWNGWCNFRKDIILIVCGSATSWIINKIIRDHDGLHNRLTNRVYLQPFTLKECEQYANALQLNLSRKEIAEAYMIMGGIPYYWSFMKRGESMAQNIDSLFFAKNSPLSMEFDALYASLFKHSNAYIEIVTALATKKAGMTRNELLENTNRYDNAVFKKVLDELEQCNFIRKYYAIGKKERDALYQLIDNFTLFYFRYIRNNTTHDEHFWSNNYTAPMHQAWAGLAFERLCLWHLPQIKAALGIAGVITSAYSWRTEATEEHEGAQIDLLIGRKDDVINFCEMKFSDNEYAISKEEEANLRRRRTVFQTVTKTRKSIHNTLITTVGIKHNIYWGSIQSVVILDDLFK